MEAGVRLVQVNWYRGLDEPPANPCWDSHIKESSRLKEVLVPPTDRAYSALLEDWTVAGCWTRRSSCAWPSSAARLVWTPTEVVVTGVGILGHAGGRRYRGGQIYGSSDTDGAYPAEGRVSPEDLSATIFHCLGYSPQTEYKDPLGRPHPISRGEVLHAIL